MLFQPVCVLRCILRFSLRANSFPHPGNGHGNGFSPVWTRMWLISLYLALNGLPVLWQPSHRQTNRLGSSVPTACSVVRCRTVSKSDGNILPHGCFRFRRSSESIQRQTWLFRIDFRKYRTAAVSGSGVGSWSKYPRWFIDWLYGWLRL